MSNNVLNEVTEAPAISSWKIEPQMTQREVNLLTCVTHGKVYKSAESS